MKKFKFNFAFLALLLGGAVAVTQSSFTTAKAHKETSAQWIFNGSALTQDKSAASYTMVDQDHPVPESCEGSALPCFITVDGDLQTYLDATTKEDIRDNADEVRN